jgi:hypothetical protein
MRMLDTPRRIPEPSMDAYALGVIETTVLFNTFSQA